MRKLDDTTFRHDLDPLVTAWPSDYDIHTAAEFVSTALLSRLDEA